MKPKLIFCILIALACTVVLASLLSVGLFSNLNYGLTDNLYGGKNALDDVVILAIDDKSLQEIGRWPWDRTVFIETLPLLNQSKVIGIDVAFFEATEDDEALGEALRAVNAIIPIEFLTFKQVDEKIIGDEMLVPVDELHGIETGYINVMTDKDGITRAANFDVGGSHDQFAYAVYKEFLSGELISKPSRFLINFVGVPGSFTRYSFSDITSGKIKPATLKNKLILIGATSPDLHDDYFVPTSKGKAMPGVEVHANTIQTLIMKDYLKHQANISVVVMMFIISIVISIVFFKFKILGGSLLSIALFIGYPFFAIIRFNHGMIMNLVYIPLIILLTFGAETIYLYVTERKAKTQIKGAFSKYVSKHVVDELLKNPDLLQLGGAKKEITVFFSDIRGFTSISEKLDPEQLVKLLNEYLTAMTNIVMEHEGVVDKYIGDAIMAFWGAPLPQEDHAIRACQTSLDMITELEKLRKKWIKEGYPELHIGIGLNTGHAVIGNMGSYERFDYTAMGDNINLGSRLEGLTKQYGVQIIISESTQKAVKEEFATRLLDLVAVKGKKQPIKIYELIGKELTKKQKEIKKHYEQGMVYYLNREWTKASNAFKQANDFASKMFIKRCESFKKSPPGRDWKGVWVMKTK